MTTTIPFSGFYESEHSYEIDRGVEQMISDSSRCRPISDRIAEDFWSHVNYQKVYMKYVQDYLAYFSSYFNETTKLNIKFSFYGMESPREYNFATDRLFAKISPLSVRKMYKACDQTILDKIIKEKFTSYDGFRSFYTPSKEAWGALYTWDHNQICCIVEALAKQYFDEDWMSGFYEGLNSNGDLSNWIYDALDEEGKRLLKISDYLRQREERKYR